MAEKESNGAKPLSLAKRVRALLEGAPEQMFTASEAAVALVDDRERVAYALARLASEGKVQRVGTGKYQSVGAAQPSGKPEKAATRAKRPAAKRAAPRGTQSRSRAVKPLVSPTVPPPVEAAPLLRWVGLLSDGRGLFEVDGVLWEGRPLT